MCTKHLSFEQIEFVTIALFKFPSAPSNGSVHNALQGKKMKFFLTMK